MEDLVKKHLVRVIRVFAVAIILTAWAAPAYAQTLTELYHYRYGSESDFLITTDFGELGNGGGGWLRLTSTMKIYDAQATGTVPLYRFFSPSYGKHLFTTDYNEVSSPTWQYEGVTGFIWPSQESGTQAIYRWLKWTGGGPTHVYVFYNQTEFSNLINTGWELEGIIGYTTPCGC